MNTPDILKDWLVKNGYTGLCNCDAECGCGFEDFAPCGEIGLCCEAAHRCDCDKCDQKTKDECGLFSSEYDVMFTPNNDSCVKRKELQ